jgi:DNA modification methylase
MITGKTYTVHVGNNLDILPTLPDNSVDAIVTDPPYGLGDNKSVADTIARWIQGERDFIPGGKGFMGKSWDSFVPPPALWDECLRVLKPGGHLLAFFGSRTQDIGALSIRLAGFEVRDSIAWMYGSGFPKSLDVSKAIDKGTGENRQRQLKFTAWIRGSGLSQAKCAELLQPFAKNLESARAMAQHYFSDKQQPAIATAEIFDVLRPYLPEVPEEIERLVAERTGIEWTAYKNREVIGQKPSSLGGTVAAGERNQKIIDFHKDKIVDITAPSTPEAQQWEGWGTALKPAFEPVIVARKPLIGTVAANVLEHGTGGLNIDGSRIGTEILASHTSGSNALMGGLSGTAKQGGYETPERVGRWPSNVILDEYTAGLLDEQSGQVKGGTWNNTEGARHFDNNGKPTNYETKGTDKSIGGASRFFYVAKASKRDRNEGLDELDPQRHSDREKDDGVGGDNPRNRTNQARQNFHPTVKPTALMRYLVKLVTPPGGVVLDPFTGSGSTGKAAILEGFEFIGIEMTDEYLPIIEGRLKHAEISAAKEKEKKDEALF